MSKPCPRCRSNDPLDVLTLGLTKTSSGRIKCSKCGGRGNLRDGALCYKCNGSGRVDCPRCDGSGRID